ncbi:hypothetical protein CXB51_014132 [Gossypium anomalum]|uniref:Late embryogenesis abundant protein LEA-2 subgroup domain-containing protein n=1 Tax=Gossypium anomalum TaxID=47600 RepID=A0A8J6D072_9ROSI|nr:hypothetical protein CXB51_014132 [Gossypium anomalum]
MEIQTASSSAAMNNDPKRLHNCRNICFATMGGLIFIIILIVILAFTVFKPKNPVVTIDSVTLADLKFYLDTTKFQVLFNVSLDVDLSIKNSNRVGFKYADSAAELNYRGQKVGEVPIPAGKISADKTAPMNLTVTVMADRFISDSNFFADVSGGELPLETFCEISGKVNILNLFKFHVVSTTSCDIIVFLSNSSVGDQNCNYNYKRRYLLFCWLVWVHLHKILFIVDCICFFMDQEVLIPKCFKNLHGRSSYRVLSVPA